MFAADAADLDVQILAAFDLVCPPVADPDDAVGYGEHLVVVRRRDDRHASLLIELAEQLNNEGAGVEVELGPVERHGAKGAGMSVYFRDPDGSLLESISYRGE